MPKKCQKCEKVLPIEAFCKNCRSPDGYHWWCRVCSSEYVSQRYHSNSEYRESLKKRARLAWLDPVTRIQMKLNHNRYSRKYKQLNFSKFSQMNRSLRQRMKSGVQFQVLERANNKCELCGLEISVQLHNLATHHLNGNRFDNRLENLIIVCTKCHLHKLHKKQ